MQEISSKKASNKITEEALKQLIESNGDTKLFRRAWIKHTGSTWQPQKSTPLLLGCFDVIAGYEAIKKGSQILAQLTDMQPSAYPVRKSDPVDKVTFDIVRVFDSWASSESSEQTQKKLQESLGLFKDAGIALLAFDFSCTAQDGLLKAVYNELMALKGSEAWTNVAFVFLVDSTKPGIGHDSGGLTLFQCYELQALSDAVVYKGRKTMSDAGEVMLYDDV